MLYTSPGTPTAGKRVNKSVRTRAALIKFALGLSRGSSSTSLGRMDGSLISVPSPGALCFQHLPGHRAGLSLLRRQAAPVRGRRLPARSSAPRPPPQLSAASRSSGPLGHGGACHPSGSWQRDEASRAMPCRDVLCRVVLCRGDGREFPCRLGLLACPRGAPHPRGEPRAGHMASWNSSRGRKVPLRQRRKITGFVLWGFPLRPFPPGRRLSL